MTTTEKFLELLERCFHLLNRIDTTLFSIEESITICRDILEKHDDDDITFEKVDN